MPLTRLIIKNFKSIKSCDISLSELNILIGENGTGKTNILDAIHYFYLNLTNQNISTAVFDENNRYSNEMQISLIYDLSEFVKISKSNSDEIPDFAQEQMTEKNRYNGYYKAIITMASKSADKKICVKLSQLKNQSVRWNCSYEERAIFKSLFPIFYIDTRNLDITKWGFLWDILGELANVSNADRKMIEDKIKTVLLDENQKIAHKLHLITEIFSAANVGVQPVMAKEFAKNLIKVFFSGEHIQQRGRHLDYYSTGTNSVKYIELLLKAVNAISCTKMKEPIVLFDEPELSLHTTYLDELAEAMLNVNTKMSIAVATHSSRLTKNLIMGTEMVSLYHVKLVDQYSVIQRMKKFPQYSPSSKYRVADDHINAYFSKAILFVEGETELEFFSNPYLRLLFPKLKKLDVFQAMSQQPILDIMNPKLTNSRTPYLCLIDMDKAIEYHPDHNIFTLKNEYFSTNEQECLRYRNKHETESYLYHQRKRIEGMQKGLRVHYYRPFWSCSDPNYDVFVTAVHRYLLAYNVFSWENTIEGVLVNQNMIEFALLYLKSKKSVRDYTVFLEYLNTLYITDKINVLRLVFHGKSDLLQGWKSIHKGLEPHIKEILEKAMIGKKASGWVSEYMDKYFRSTAGLTGLFSERVFQRYLEKDQNRQRMIATFRRDFFELYSLIGCLYDIM